MYIYSSRARPRAPVYARYSHASKNAEKKNHRYSPGLADVVPQSGRKWPTRSRYGSRSLAPVHPRASAREIYSIIRLHSYSIIIVRVIKSIN